MFSEAKQTPYIGFPLTSSCSFNCLYCRPGGETFSSEINQFDKELVFNTAKHAYSLGSRKFRITGGEPFIHKDLGNILFTLAKFKDVQITVNTTGIPLINRQGILSETPDNVKFIISLDSLNSKTFKKIRPSKIPDAHQRVLTSIHILASKGILKRLNMVVTKENIKEIFDLIDFCRNLGCDLKVADIAKNQNQNQLLNEIYAPIDEIELKLKKTANRIEKHKYSQQFGIPCNIYTINGVKVTVKNSKNGARYNLDEQFCGNCNDFPCHEGLYFVSSLPDGSFSTCRLDKIHITGDDTKKSMIKAIKVIENSQFLNKK